MDTRRMTDIHMHIIPGVDDGSFSMEMSMSMLFMAYKQGVKDIFATPHSMAFEDDPELVQENFRILRQKAEELPFGIRIFQGCEVRCEPYAMEQTLEKLEKGIFPSMNGSRYVLTELSSRVVSGEALRMASQLKEAGWIPIIAHAERYPSLAEGGVLKELLGQGCLLQINAYSLEDEGDEAVLWRAKRMLQERQAAFLGSDAHRMNHRPPGVESGIRYLYEHCPREYADAVAFGNAETYLLGGLES